MINSIAKYLFLKDTSRADILLIGTVMFLVIHHKYIAALLLIIIGGFILAGLELHFGY